MANPRLSDEAAIEAAIAYRAANESPTEAARLLGIPRQTFQNRLNRARERGLLTGRSVEDGFRLTKISTTPNGEYTQQKPDNGVPFEPTNHLAIKGKTSWLRVLPDGQRIAEREVVMERAGAQAQAEAMRAAVEAFKEELPRAIPVAPPLANKRQDLLNFYGVTDAHFGALSWREETGADYDIKIAEQLLTDWFAAAIELSPPAATAVLGQMGDLAHYDGMESKTPASGHILDADSRFQRVVRAIIRTMRRVIAMLLEKHDRVHVIMADANHDPASGAWLREMFAAFYDDEPRVTVDSSASTYYVYEHGKTSLFVHHGHRRNVNNVDSVFAGRFRDIYGRTKFSYAHLGHLHSDELKTTNLMKVERHETLAAPDAYAANGGWLSGRSAKVITYSSEFGEVSRLVLTPEMVGGWSAPLAANDNQPVSGRRSAA